MKSAATSLARMSACFPFETASTSCGSTASMRTDVNIYSKIYSRGRKFLIPRCKSISNKAQHGALCTCASASARSSQRSNQHVRISHGHNFGCSRRTCSPAVVAVGCGSTTPAATVADAASKATISQRNSPPNVSNGGGTSTTLQTGPAQQPVMLCTSRALDPCTTLGRAVEALQVRPCCALP